MQWSMIGEPEKRLTVLLIENKKGFCKIAEAFFILRIIIQLRF